MEEEKSRKEVLSRPDIDGMGACWSSAGWRRGSPAKRASMEQGARSKEHEAASFEFLQCVISQEGLRKVEG